jgi:hypothetical protein
VGGQIFAGPPNRGVWPDCRRRAQVARLITKLCGDKGVWALIRLFVNVVLYERKKEMCLFFFSKINNELCIN